MRLTRIIPQRGINDDNKGKKHALHQLISAAETEYVELMDDDVQSAPDNPPLEGDLILMPIRMEGGKSLLERLQIAEYAAIQELTMMTAKQGRGVLCSGAHLIVKRERWLESWEDLHPELPSGDDMFLLESFKRRGLDIRVADEERYTAVIQAVPTWRAFWRQRMRWAGKSGQLKDPDMRRVGLMVLIANIMQLICPLVILVKFPIEYRLIKKRDPKVSLGIGIVLEIVYPLYMLVCLVGGFFRRGHW